MPRFRTVLPALLLAAAAQSASAAGAVPEQEGTGMPATPEAWLSRMLDATRNGSAFKDPAVFAEWLDAITEPRFMTALAAVAMDPSTYPNALAHAMDPAAARNWSEFTDPQLYLRWMLAGANPSFQQAIVTNMGSPGKASRWAAAAARPDGYAAAMAAVGRAPVAWLQPATPLGWVGAMRAGMARQASDPQWRTLPAGKAADGAPGAAVRYRY